MGFVSKSKWIGKSGRVYVFDDYSLDTVFVENLTGNYIFSKWATDNGKTVLNPVYIGEGVIKDRIEFRVKEGKIQKKGCNCVSVKLLEKGEDSKKIEEDLLAEYLSAYEPVGCNIKAGG